MSTEEQIPVTVLSGTLGAGKTTLLNTLLEGDHGRDIAVVVNDVGDVNVDAELVERRGDSEEVLELSNGCICCGLQSELERSVIQLTFNHEFDHLVVEPSGISEPAPVARQFVQGRAAGLYTLDSITTVVDARQFYDAFENGEPVRRGETDDGTRPLSDLIVDGVEFCDTLVLNKTDLVTESELEVIRADLRTLQPEATVITTAFGDVDPETIIDSGRFDPDAVTNSARWRQIIEDHQTHEQDDGHSHESHDHSEDGHEDHDRGEDHDHSHEDHDHKHPPEVYGVDSFVYHCPEPMHPGRLADFLRETPENIIRMKGWLHVAGRPDHALDLSLAGHEAHVSVAGRWVASLPTGQQDRYREPEMNWTEEYGDRETQLVVIGQNLNPDQITSELDSCLLQQANQDDTEPNPFPEREDETVQFR